MNEVRPYGDAQKADLFIIGHDPRLQESDTKAEYVFFLDYLARRQPAGEPELRKYNLAKAVIDYISYLTSNRYNIGNLDKLYVTNLCNRFLHHPMKKGQTVLIPGDEAECGISDIEKTLQIGSFKLMLPMSLQVFYHLVRRGFIPNEASDMKEFLSKAQPKKSCAAQGAYVPTEGMSFVDVCGNHYVHGQVAVIPILHVKNWQRMVKKDPYSSKMKRAVENISRILLGY